MYKGFLAKSTKRFKAIYHAPLYMFLIKFIVYFNTCFKKAHLFIKVFLENFQKTNKSDERKIGCLLIRCCIVPTY